MIQFVAVSSGNVRLGSGSRGRGRPDQNETIDAACEIPKRCSRANARLDTTRTHLQAHLLTTLEAETIDTRRACHLL